MTSSNPPEFSTVLHIGAGRTTELESWLEHDSVESVILVEAHPYLAEQLRLRTSTMPQVTVLEMAVSSETDLDQLHEYNLPEFSSLRLPLGLRQIFPGLKIEQSYTVDTIDLEQFFKEYLPQEDKSAHLIIEAAGEETALVQALVASSYLERVSTLTLVAGSDALYEGSKPAIELLELLKENGYELYNQKSLTPEFAQWSLQRNQLKDELMRTQKKLEHTKAAFLQEKNSSQQAVNNLKSELEELNSLIEKQVVEFKESLASKESEFAKRREGHKIVLKTLRLELDNTKAELAKEKASFQQVIARLKSEATGFSSLLGKQAAEFKEILASQESEFTKRKEGYQATHKIYKTELDKVKTALAKEKKQSLELGEDLAKAKAKNKILARTNELLEQSQTTMNKSYQQLSKRLEQLFAEQSTQIQQSSNALGKHVTQSFVEQRQYYQSVLGLQHYLESGEQPLEFGGWTIGSDVASHLIRALAQNNYDLVIEFGSGTSTVLMAKVIAQQLANSTDYAEYTQLDYESSVPMTTQSQVRQIAKQSKDLARFEVPRRILSFEQDKQYYERTKHALQSQGLDALVELVLAPLVPTAFCEGNKAALFYDCDKEIAQLAQLFGGRAARILVLVDGPFSPKADPLVRVPALAHILQHLSAHHLDIVLDDSKCESEQQVVQVWRDLCDDRGLTYKEEELDTEKGALWVTVTP